MQENISLEVLPPNTVFKIEINTDLYIRLQQLLLEGLPYKNVEEFQEILKSVKDNTATSGLAYHVHTLLHLLQTIETTAREANLIEKKSYNPETKQVV